jgi:hypothetical protein
LVFRVYTGFSIHLCLFRAAEDAEGQKSSLVTNFSKEQIPDTHKVLFWNYVFVSLLLLHP